MLLPLDTFETFQLICSGCRNQVLRLDKQMDIIANAGADGLAMTLQAPRAQGPSRFAQARNGMGEIQSIT